MRDAKRKGAALTTSIKSNRSKEEMRNFEDLLKIAEEDFKELQFEELTSIMNEGQESISTLFYFIIF